MEEKITDPDDKKGDCVITNHLWVLVDRWTDEKCRVWYEFYCQYCMKIMCQNTKRRKS